MRLGDVLQTQEDRGRQDDGDPVGQDEPGQVQVRGQNKEAGQRDQTGRKGHQRGEAAE